MSERHSLLILGASARAAAASAIRAGFAPLAIDRFGDVDLQTTCVSRRSADYPADLFRLTRELPAAPWLYCGALENRPALVDAIARTRTLYGNSGRVLAAVRDPFLLARVLREAGLPRLEVRALPPPADLQGWLQKPVRSCGGSHIRHADDRQRSGLQREPDPYFFQRFADGIPCSAVYVANCDGALLLGVTRQLIGCPWCGASGFQYSGSIGPLPIDTPTLRSTGTQLRQIGHCLMQRFELRGLFGIDFVLGGQTVWPIEVNPRYTASVEVLERACGFHAIGLHVAACRGEPVVLATNAPARCVAGKSIVYATRPSRVEGSFGELARHWNSDGVWPALADIPSSGTELRPGEPIATVLAAGGSIDDVERRLQELAGQVQQVISGCSS